jgi:hypothetical protein
MAQDFLEQCAGPAQFHGSQMLGKPGEIIMPFDVIPAVDADLVATLFRLPQHAGKGCRYHGRRQERAVQHGSDAIGRRRLGAQHLSEEPLAGEDASDGLARIVRSHGKIEGG